MPDALTEGGADLLRVTTIGQAVRSVAQAFREAGLESPELDARILVAEGAGVPRPTLLAAPELRLDADAARRIAVYRARRLAREPVSRIVGAREFHGLMLEVGAATLDPRPETETVVEIALDLVRQGAVSSGAAPRILDLGTGTGAILIALLAQLPAARGVGTDVAPAALDIARRNAQRHGVAERADFRCSDWLVGMTETFDLVISNPPYIASGQIATLEAEVSLYDPRLALDGGEDGLAAYHAILSGVFRVLDPAGWLLLEVSPGDAGAVFGLCRLHGFEPGAGRSWFSADLAGLPRCVAVKARR